MLLQPSGCPVWKYFTTISPTPSLPLSHLSEIVDEGVVVPHVLLGQVGASLPIFVFLLYRVVTQVDGLVEILHFIRLRTESKIRDFLDWLKARRSARWPEIWRFVHPDNQRVPVRDQHPLSDVELGVVDQQRPLDVFLHNKSDISSYQLCTLCSTVQCGLLATWLV